MKIKLTNGCFLLRKRLLMSIMRVFIFLFCTTFFGLTPKNGISQNSKIKIEESKTLTVDEVFDLITNQTDYNFFYEKNLFKNAPSIRVNKGVIKTEDLLDKSLSASNFEIIITNEFDFLIKEIPAQVVKEQQEYTISGIVLDASNQPLPGANIVEKGSINGIQTDFDGNFEIVVANENSTLVVSYIGYKTKEVKVGNQTKLSINLEVDAADLDEVIVVGYGVQKRSNLTGAVGTVTAKDIENKPVVNVQELLIGKVPGLNVTSNGGRPGSGASINIRGLASIGGQSPPLVIIDGIPGNIYTVNPNDIESISVLKDAASAAIYGARAANGVILITTKSFKKGDLKVSITTSLGMQSPDHHIDFVGSENYMTLFNKAQINDGFEAKFTQQDFDDLAAGKLPDHQWNRDIFSNNNIIQNNYLSFSGQTEKVGL